MSGSEDEAAVSSLGPSESMRLFEASMTEDMCILDIKHASLQTLQVLAKCYDEVDWAKLREARTD